MDGDSGAVEDALKGVMRHNSSFEGAHKLKEAREKSIKALLIVLFVPNKYV